MVDIFDSSVGVTVSTDNLSTTTTDSLGSSKISKTNGHLTTSVEDTLTCGSCARDFSLSEIIKFIDHKVINGCLEFGTLTKCRLDFCGEDKDDYEDCCSCLDFEVPNSNNNKANASALEQLAKPTAISSIANITCCTDLRLKIQPKLIKTEDTSMEVDPKESSQSQELHQQNETEDDDDDTEALNDTQINQSVVHGLHKNDLKIDDKENQNIGNQVTPPTNIANNNNQPVQESQIDSNLKKEIGPLQSDTTQQQEVNNNDNSNNDGNSSSTPNNEKSKSTPLVIDFQLQHQSDSGSNSPLTTPMNTSKCHVAHNHLCRHYRRLCKHYQRALLSRTLLSSAYSNSTGERCTHINKSEDKCMQIPTDTHFTIWFIWYLYVCLTIIVTIFYLSLTSICFIISYINSSAHAATAHSFVVSLFLPILHFCMILFSLLQFCPSHI